MIVLLVPLFPVQPIHAADCPITTWVNATIATASENAGDGVTTSTGLISSIDTDGSGSINLSFTWDALTDLPNTEDSSVYLRITPSDGTASGTAMTSAAFNLDTKAPVAPGDLAINTTSTQSVTFTLGSAATDDNFKEYIIYYKPGASGVAVSDSSFTSSTDADLGAIDFNSTATTQLSGLATSTQYVANIWAYDNIGHLTPAVSEIAFYTLAATPGTPTVTASSSATILHLTIDPLTNPNTAAVTYALCKTSDGASCAAGSSYVQANGSLGVSAVWQTYTVWGGTGGVEVTGLTPNTAYKFLVQAKNGDGVVTAFSSANAPVTTSNVGMTVTQSSGTTLVTEGGATDSYTLVLTSKPASDVTITVATDTFANISASTFTFTSVNWATPQTITVTANNDAIAQGSHSTTITHVVTSADLTYNGISVSDVTATVTDNDTSGVTLSATTVATTEGGSTGSYTIVLDSQPTSTVQILLTSTSAQTVSTSTIDFTASNWNTAVTVTVTAVDNAIVDGTHTGTISHVASSTGTGYNASTVISDVTNTVTDNDLAAQTNTGGGGLGAAGSPSLLPLVTTFQTTAVDQGLLDNLKLMNIPIHGLVKLVNDGNELTQEDTAVYYIAVDGKRHAFPNSKVYFTWYSNFDGVQTVTNDQIASIPLGKNVTYKPGVRMVKFTTDPKVYAVDKGGILRWITSEPVAIYLYGLAWNQNVDDIDDAFFANYRFGSSINNTGDFNPAEARASVQFPSDSLEM